MMFNNLMITDRTRIICVGVPVYKSRYVPTNNFTRLTDYKMHINTTKKQPSNLCTHSNYVLLAANGRVGSAFCAVRGIFFSSVIGWVSKFSIRTRINAEDGSLNLSRGALNSCTLLPRKSETGISHRIERHTRALTHISARTNAHSPTRSRTLNKRDASFNLPTLLVTVIIVQSFPTSLCFYFISPLPPVFILYFWFYSPIFSSDFI